MIDELHCIGENKRGGTLEGTAFSEFCSCFWYYLIVCVLSGIIARFQTRKATSPSAGPIADLRIVGVSATLSNSQDFADWLNADLFVFGDAFRPCPLVTHVLGFPPLKNECMSFKGHQ